MRDNYSVCVTRSGCCGCRPLWTSLPALLYSFLQTSSHIENIENIWTKTSDKVARTECWLDLYEKDSSTTDSSTTESEWVGEDWMKWFRADRDSEAAEPNNYRLQWQ